MASSCSLTSNRDSIDKEACRESSSASSDTVTGTAEGILAGYKYYLTSLIGQQNNLCLNQLVKALNEVLEDETFKFNSKVAKEAREAAVLLLDWVKKAENLPVVTKVL